MLRESVSESSEGLSNILFPAVLAGKAIDHIGASTTDFFHAGVAFLGMMTDNMVIFANDFATPTIEGVAERESSILLGGAQWFFGGRLWWFCLWYGLCSLWDKEAI